MKIRPATDADCDAIWNIFHEVVAAADTYALDSDISREDALGYWFAPGTHTYVAEQPAIGVAGSYVLKPNQSGGGSHVANAGFMVSASARGRESVAQWPSIACTKHADSVFPQCNSIM